MNRHMHQLEVFYWNSSTTWNMFIRYLSSALLSIPGEFIGIHFASQAVKICPRFGQGRVVVGSLLDNLEDLELMTNSLASAFKEGSVRSMIRLITVIMSFFFKVELYIMFRMDFLL